MDYTDTYALGGVLPPQAPYAGSFGGPGPLTGNLPTSRNIVPVLLSTDSAFLSNQVFTSIDMDVSSLTLGPTLSRSWGPLNLAIQGGIILNVYQWEARQAERLSATTSAAGGRTAVARWAAEDSGTKFRPGLYAQTDLSYAVNNHFGLGGFLRLDVASEFRAQVGPTVFKVDPGGFTTGIQFRYMLP